MLWDRFAHVVCHPLLNRNAKTRELQFYAFADSLKTFLVAIQFQKPRMSNKTQELLASMSASATRIDTQAAGISKTPDPTSPVSPRSPTTNSQPIGTSPKGSRSPRGTFFTEQDELIGVSKGNSFYVVCVWYFIVFTFCILPF